MKITTLGTSHGDHTYCRFNSSTLFESGKKLYLFDAGAPVNGLMIRKGKAIQKLKAVFITHLHEDHAGGLTGIIKSLLKYPQENQRTDIFLPEKGAGDGLGAWLKTLRLPWPSELVNVKYSEPGKIFDDGVLAVSAEGTAHLPRKGEDFSSFSYILKAEGKRIVYTGDLSGSFDDFPAAAKEEECDLCICEATHYDMQKALPILKACPIKRLIFNHIGDKWHGDGEGELRAFSEALPYPCQIAHDGNVFEL